MSLIVNRGFELDLKSEWLKGGSDGSAVEYGWGVAPYKL
jgi:hypothetical protein